jgi:hypothetical protein
VLISERSSKFRRNGVPIEANPLRQQHGAATKPIRDLPEIVMPPMVCGYRNAKSSLLSNESNQNAGCRGYIGDSFWSTNLRFSRVQDRAFLLASLCSYLTILLV